MVSNRALHVKVRGKSVKFKRSERLNPNPQVAKFVARKSGVSKGKKTVAKKKRPRLTICNVRHAKHATIEPGESNQPEKTKCWLFWGPMDVLEVTNTL